MDLEESVRLRQAIARLARQFNTTSTDENLSPSQASVLGLVAGLGPLGLAELAELEHLHPTMLSRVVGKLVGEGLIERQADPLDLRSARVAITDQGHVVHERIRRDRAAILRRGVDQLAPDETAALLAALPALESLARELSAPPTTTSDRVRPRS